MIYLELFLTFFKVGIFSFGGGYAMIPVLSKSVEENAWMTHSEVADALAMSQMAPGPLFLNAATFIGSQKAGVLGAAAAVSGVLMPSLIIILLLARFFYGFQLKNQVQFALTGVRPAVFGLIFGAACTLLAGVTFAGVDIYSYAFSFTELIRSTDLISLAVVALSLLALIKWKVRPWLLILLSAAAGVAAYLICEA